MTRTCLTSIVFLALAGPALAQSATVDKLRGAFDCQGYRFTDIRQRADMQRAIPVWTVVNEGPSAVAVYIGNSGQKLIDFPANTGSQSHVFVGDADFRYTLGLAGEGSAVAYICLKK